MAVIIKQPVLLATAFMDRSNQNSRFVGAQSVVQIGSNIYAAVASGNASPAFAVFKSTDGGKTWTQKDAAHTPAVLVNPSYEVIAAQDGIYFVWDGDGSGVPFQSLGYCRFDPSTDLWGAVHATPNMTAPGDRLAIARRSNGDIVVIFTSQNPVANDLQFGIFSHATGAWGGANNFFTTITGLTFGVAALVGPDDTVYVLSQDGGVNTQIFFQTISPTNVVSVAVLIGTIAAGEIVPGLAAIWNNQLIFPYADLNASHPAMFVGAPINAPVWSNVALSAVTPVTNVGMPVAFVSAQNTLLLFVTLQANPVFQLWFSTFASNALAAPSSTTLYYDAVVNPPAAGPVDELLGVSVIPFGGRGGVAGMVGMQLTAGSPPENAYFLLPGCPPNAQGV